MNPVIVIPTYWCETDRTHRLGERGVYDYSTPIAKPLPELEICLDSLENVRGVIRIIVLVATETGLEDSARARVNSICRSHPNLNIVVIGEKEAAYVQRAVGRMIPAAMGNVVSLHGYGAIKNMGLAVAAILEHDAVVFLDDDEVVSDADFLINAVYGLGALTRQGLQIVAKSGYFIDENGSPYAKPSNEWTERYWSKANDFNSVMAKAQSAKRVTRSNHMCGGCCALHAAAYTKIPFDPYITRGEDLDYMLNLRANGLDVWFDNKWYVRLKKPEDMSSPSSLFMQDTYRWYYEYRKLEVINSRRDLRTITQESLMPYPGPWLFPEVRKRVFQTALRRMVAGPDRAAYLGILTRGRQKADKFAKDASTRYLSFAMTWPTVAVSLWGDRTLSNAILRTGEVSVSISAAMAMRQSKIDQVAADAEAAEISEELAEVEGASPEDTPDDAVAMDVSAYFDGESANDDAEVEPASNSAEAEPATPADASSVELPAPLVDPDDTDPNPSSISV